MLRILNNLVVALTLLLGGAGLFADQLFLAMPVEAKGQSLGGAGTSYISGPASLYYNPAGLIDDSSAVSGQISHFILGNNVNASSAVAGFALTPFFYVGGFVKALYLSESFDRVENFSSVSENLSVMNTVAGLSAAVQLLPNFTAGLTAKYFRLKLGSVVSQSVNADVGFRYRLPIRGGEGHYRNLTMGLFVENLGSKIDYYGGAVRETQPISFKTGFSYGLYRWVNVVLDYSFSVQEFSSFNLGGDFLPDYMFSPKMGMKMDLVGGEFLNYSFSVGGGFRYGNEVKVEAIIGSSLGTTLSLAQTFVSVYVTQNKDFFSKKTSKSNEIDEDKSISVETISKSWLPYNLVPYNSGYRVEKVQAIELSVVESAGFIEAKRLFHRTVVQPEDEIYLEKMTKAKKSEMHLLGRKIGIWMEFENFEDSDAVGYWDICSSIIEGQGKYEVLMGQDLLTLNANNNAPKRVEFKLKLTRMAQQVNSKKIELKTVLEEQYGFKIVLAKNFSIEGDETIIDLMKKISDFYATYFSNVKAYYVLRMKRTGVINE